MEDFEDCLETKLRGVLNCSGKCVPTMVYNGPRKVSREIVNRSTNWLQFRVEYDGQEPD